MSGERLPWPEQSPSHGQVRLCRFDESAIAMGMDLATDPYVPLITTLPAHADRTQVQAWIDGLQSRLAQGAGYPFMITDAATREALGAIGLWLDANDRGRASIGYFVAPRARGRGAARDAVRAVTQFAWNVPDLVRLEAYIEPTNESSLRTAEASGFSREGLRRSSLEIGGVRRDMVIYAKVRGD